MNLYKISAPLKVAVLMTDPSPVEDGVIYYNSSLGAFRMYQNGTWQTTQASGGSLTGSPLTQGSILIGDASNLSAQADTLAQGDITASPTGLNIKAGVIDNADISATAAIALTKLGDTQNAVGDGAVLIENSNKIVKTGIAASNLFLADGSIPATGAFNLNSHKITNVTDPTNLQDAATKNYVDNVGGNFANRGLTNLLGPTAVNVSLLPDLSATIDLGSMTKHWLSAYIDNVNATAVAASTVTASTSVSTAALTATGAASLQAGLNMNGTVISNVAAPSATTDATNKDYVDTAISNVDIGLTGKALLQNYVVVGDASNLSAAYDTAAQGDILAGPTGLNIKAGIIVDADINASAAIAYSKLATLGGATNDILVRDASGHVVNSPLNLAEVFRRDGSVVATGTFDLGGFKITNMADPSTGSDAASKAYVDSVAQGLRPKEAVAVATTADITLSGLQTIDGYLTVSGDRVLVKDQSAPAQNGIYVAAVGAWTRATDFDSVSPINEIKGASVPVEFGTTNAGKVYVCTSSPTTVGTDPILFVFYNSIATLVAGNGITISGANISVNHDSQGLGFSSQQLALVLDGATLFKSASGVRVNNTAFPASLIPDTDNTRALGSASVLWSTVHTHGVINDVDALALQGQAATFSLGNAIVISAASVSETYSGNASSTATGTQTIAGSSIALNAPTNGLSVDAKSYQQFDNQYALSANISSPTPTGLSFSATLFRGATIEFSVKQANGPVRTGHINLSNDGTNVSYAGTMVDQGTVGNAGNLAFSADISGGNVRLLYTGTDATNAATLNAVSKLFKA